MRVLTSIASFSLFLVIPPTLAFPSIVAPRAAESSQATCDGTFSPISARDFVNALNPGWNLGNTLDAIENEGDWGNAPVTGDTFDDVKARGFKGVRLPITWAYHFASESPDWTVNSAWLQRVSDVVDMVTSRGLHTIVNVHHDSWVWADVSASGANYTLIEEKFYRLWYQIGTKLACKSELVAFEPINEPPGTTEEHAVELNKLNNIFLQAINDAGGFNSQRVVTLVGLGEDSIKTSQWFEAPSSDFTNPWAIQFHYYSPYDFIFGAWGKTTWGSDAEKQTLEADFANIRGNFTDIPLVIGEWAAFPASTETAARWKYYDFFAQTARKYGMSAMVWDAAEDFLDRDVHAWNYKSTLDVYFSAVKGVANALPDSTVAGDATSQFTSAYVFHQVGSAVTDQTLPFLFNGNTLSSISIGNRRLASGRDYTVDNANIIFKSSFLSSQGLNTNDGPGIKANLTLTFSSGAPLILQMVQWDVPTLTGGSSSRATSGTQVSVPITWKGISKPAAVKALAADGTYLFDDWTQYLGPLQQARMTRSSQWDWNTGNVILTSSVSDAVVAKGQSVQFTIEFFPRVAGNSVNYTLTV